MNKNRFRIIFNQARGMLMAVAEYIASAGKSVRASVAATSAPATRQATNTTVTLKPTHFACVVSLGLVSLVGSSVFANPAHADIIADKSAPNNQQATVLSAPNGVPLVNIQTPSAAGVSHNTYSRFDVNTNGAILNNSRTNVQTQLGGWVQGNSSLATGSARIILNEVNSSNPSLLNGYVEVAGSRAQVVIANPAGISCNGCGFINASRATLTTGTPMLSGGDLIGYRVTSGTINFLGTGLDASQTNYTDIIARAVTIQNNGTTGAGIFANNLNIITGVNQVNVSSTQNDTNNYLGAITPITPTNTASNPTPTYALDVAALGGMYAGKIHMIGTEAGLGMHNAGRIGASVGEVHIDANGMLTNTSTGRITSAGNTQVTATNGISNQGTIYAQGNTTLTTSGDLTNTGMIAALGDTTLAANGANSHIDSAATSVIAAGLNADGSLNTGTTGNLSLTATQSITAFGQNLSEGDQTITAQSLDLSGSSTVGRNLAFMASNGNLNATDAIISASNTLTASTTQTLITDTAKVSANQLNLAAHDLSNVAGELVQTGTGDTNISLAGGLNNDRGRIATNSSNLTLAAQTLANTSGSIEHAGTGKLAITATIYNGTGSLIQSNGALDFKATTATLDNGSTVAKQISMDTATLSNKNGEIIQTGTGTTAIKATTKLDNTGGVIASNGNTNLAVGDLVNQGGAIQAANTANLTVNATGAINNKALNSVTGSLQAGGAAIINAGSIDNRQGQVTAGTTLNIATTDATNGIDNNQGLIAANQTLTASTANLGNTNGTITTTADLDLQTGALTNDAGLIQSGSNIVINTHGQALINNNSGSSKGILSQGSTTLTTGALNNQAGYIGARGAITANSTTISNNTGAVISEATVALNGTSLDNQTGTVEALGNIDINTTGNIDNRTGLLRSGQTLTLAAASVDNRNTQGTDATGTPTQGIEAQSVNITADQIDNSTGAMRANDMLAINDSGTLNNSQGKLSSAGALSITDRLANANSNVAGKTLAITNTSGTIIAGAGIADTGLNIDSKSLTGDGKVLSKGNLATKLTSDYTNTGEWQADGNATFTTTGILTNQAKLLAGNTLNLTAGTLNNQATGEIVGTTLHLAATDIHTLTNRGLIDGSDTFIDTITLNNIGTGRIYGDHVAIAAATLTNDVETVNGVTSAAVIAARNRLDIGAQTITNREHALLFSAGDMAIGGSLDGSHQATVATGQPQATTLNNSSATIEALGDLSINAARINNTNAHFSTQSVVVGTEARNDYQRNGSPNQYNSSQVSLIYRNGGILIQLNAPDGATTNFFRYDYTRTTTETQIASSDPAKLLSGGNMQINAGNVLNNTSQIVAGGALTGTIGTLTNTEVAGNRTIIDSGSLYYLWEKSISGKNNNPTITQYWGGYNPAPTVQSLTLTPTVYKQNTAPTSSGTQISALTTGSVSQTATGASSASASISNSQTLNAITQVAAISSSATGPGTIIRSGGVNTTLPNNSLFQTNPNPASNYLIATDPRFTDYRNWISSDYMMSQLAFDPALTQKRLGDGFYEQKLIREQVAQLTGRRFLEGYVNDETQYQALMNAGVTTAQTLQLTPGIALTPEQTAQLTSDIVWLVQKTVILADGSQQNVLVPQLYVRLQDGDLLPSGALIAGDSVDLKLTGDLGNAGTIAGRNIVSLGADNINNLGGRISANNTLLSARNDINNIGGIVEGGDTLSLTAGRDINIASTTSTQSSSQGARTNLSRVAGLYVGVKADAEQRAPDGHASNPNAILVVSAGRDVNLMAASIVNSGTDGAEGTKSTTRINAGNNLNLGTVTETSSQANARNSKNYLRVAKSSEIGTSIQTDSDLTLNAGNNLSARAADVTSDNGTLNVVAGNDLTIAAGKATYASESASYTKKKGTFSSKSKTTRDTANGTDVIGSTFSGESVNMTAGNNLTVKGSNVVGTHDTNLDAGNNITLTTEQATQDETHFSKTKKSGFSASSSSIGYGSSKLTNTNDSQQVTNVGSTVGSVAGDVNINAGKTYNQAGSDALTPQGDINITAQQVNITNATDTYANQQSMKYKQTGITLAVSNPVISAIQTAQQMSKAAGKTNDPRMQALAAATTALAVNNAAEAVAKSPDTLGGINVSLSIGTSKSSSKTTQTNSTAKSSTLNAGGDINISAVRPALVEEQNEGAGTINVIGSQIKAANDVTLKADDQINLQAAQNIDTLNSNNKNSSASVGVSVGTTSGLAVTASASQGKGKTNGNGTTWTETQIQGGNQQGDKVSLNSGTDTNLIGAQVTGNQVVANVGTSGTGNLNIESLQDTNQYKDKQQSTGISVSVPIGAGGYGGSISASNSNTKSNYASVNEQSGIMAGDGGFQVAVNGNTNLKGAVIASTEQAVKDNKNSLTTQTLTTSNIENSAEYSAKGTSVSAGVGFNQQPGGTGYKNSPTASAGYANLNDDSSSTTVSGVSTGQVNITDGTAQQQATGKDALTTVATLNRDVTTQTSTNADGSQTSIAVDSNGNNLAGTLTPIFDKEQVQRELNAQTQITQAFSQVAPKAVADYAGSKVKELKDTDPAEAAKWDEGGIYRIALHTALGGLITGDISGALGAGVTAGAAPLLNDLQKAVTEQLTKAGASNQAASTISQALAELTSLGIGSVIGGQAGASTALVVDTNNRQLHYKERDLIKKLAADKAESVCNGRQDCINKVTIGWTDLLESTAESLVDDKKAAENAQKFAAILATANIPNSEGALGGVESYLATVNEAQAMLAPYMGKSIIVNGKVQIIDGAKETYFSATDAQRADQYAGDFLGSPPDTIIPGKTGRNETLLEHLSAINGSATPDHTVEELFIGGKLTDVGVKLLAKTWVNLEVKLAGETVSSLSGNISAKQVTESGIQATLTNYDRMILGDIAKLPNTTLQGDAREIVVNNYFMRNGFTPLDGKCGANCFDGVFIKGDKVYIVETKPLNADGTIVLNAADKSTNLPRQMSGDWIADRIRKLAQSSDPNLQKTAAILDAADKSNSIIKVVAGADAKGVTLVRLKGD